MLPRRLQYLGLAVTCALTAAACGGGSPTGATPVARATPDTGLSAGTVMEVVSGETSGPVAGARVTMGPRTYQTDGGGRILVAESVPYGTYVDVVASGFLDRQTLVRREGTRFVLWPDTYLGKAAFDQAYTASIVYTSSSETVPGNTPLRRLPRSATQAVVVLSDELRANEYANPNHVLAVNELNATLGGRFTYLLAPSRPASGIVFEARSDLSESLCASNSALAFARVTLQSGEITGGQIVYCGVRMATTHIALHELGHTAGLFHSLDVADVMHPYRTAAERFSRGEALALSLLFERPGGNRFPDNDRSASAAARETVTIVCR